jgi:hypothetical protein
MGVATVEPEPGPTKFLPMDYEAAVATFFTTAPEGTMCPPIVTDGGPARQLRDALEPLAMHAVWAQEVYQALSAHGLDFMSAYVCGRGSSLGDVPSSVVAAAFAVFPLEAIDQLWTDGLSKLERTELIALRDRGVGASLRRVLGDVTTEAEVLEVAETLELASAAADGAGRPLFSALRTAPILDDPYARLWRAADVVREHRGDGHVATCVGAGLDGCEMNILTELWLGYPLGEYSHTRGWSQEATASAIASLTVSGLIADWQLTKDGWRFRTQLEDRTDESQRTLIRALGHQLTPVLEKVSAWSDRCILAGVFPSDPRKRAAG